MFNQSTESVVIFTVCIATLICIFVTFSVTIVYRYRQKQNLYCKELATLKVKHENDLMKAQLEIQEYTLNHITRQIHDNIGQKLSLVKLYLNTVADSVVKPRAVQVTSSIGIMAEVINDLSDIAKSMSSETILIDGLVKSVEFEVAHLRKSGVYEIELLISGNPIFFDCKNEIIVFRIIQETLHNIMKHSGASEIKMNMHYTNSHLRLSIKDNGSGFKKGTKKSGNGIYNIRKRVSLLNGIVEITSGPDGTELISTLPIQKIQL